MNCSLKVLLLQDQNPSETRHIFQSPYIDSGLAKSTQPFARHITFAPVLAAVLSELTFQSVQSSTLLQL
jgi:hypothetical protein